MDKQPLVSVCVITYNSSKYVLETLESIYNQTYRNLELIVSDDCSTDNTVEICQEWIAQHQERFVRTEIVTVPKNTGISANCNRAYRACRAEWVKGIAGDDLLLPECIAINKQYVKEHPEARLIFSKIIPFSMEKDQVTIDFRRCYAWLLMPPKIHFIELCQGNLLPAPSCMMQKSLFEELGGYDESIPMIEDWPFWIKASYKNIHFDFVPKHTVKYRISSSSISMGKASKAYLDSLSKCIHYSEEIQKKKGYILWMYGKLRRMRLNNNNTKCKLLFKVLITLNPYSFIVKYYTLKVNRIANLMDS